MTRVVAEVRRALRAAGRINLLENDAEAMLAVASAAGADFVRIKVYVGAMLTPFGVESGQAYAAIRARNAWDARDVAIFADVHDRTGVPLATGGLAEDLDHAVRLGGADGARADRQELCARRSNSSASRESASATAPILVGGGVNAGEFRRGRARRRRRDRQLRRSRIRAPRSADFVPAKVTAFMEEARRVRAMR